ncbi:MAG: flagellar biosynthesis protein FlgN [Ruegeria sp.]
MDNDPIRALEDLLDNERAALIQGDLTDVSRFTPEKETLIGAINDLHVLESDDLSRVQKKVARNQALLNSAAEGIRAVADRMSELRRIKQEFSTYDASGQRNGFALRSQAKLEKRA